MALQDITTKILDDGASRAQEIVKSTQGEVAALMHEAQEQQKKTENEHDIHISTLLDAMEHAALSHARRDARQTISNEKRILINQVKKDAVQNIVEADDAVYTSFLTHILSDFDPATTLTEVRVPQSRIVLTKKVLTDMGVTAPLIADDAVDAGMVFIGDSADYDFTLERRMSDLTTELESMIVKNIFAQ